MISNRIGKITGARESISSMATAVVGSPDLISRNGLKGFSTGVRSLEYVAVFYREAMEGMMDELYIVDWQHCG